MARLSRVIERFFQMLGLALSDDEKKFLATMNYNPPKSMRVVGRGSLVMDASEARKTPEAKDFMTRIGKLTLIENTSERPASDEISRD